MNEELKKRIAWLLCIIPFFVLLLLFIIYLLLHYLFKYEFELFTKGFVYFVSLIPIFMGISGIFLKRIYLGSGGRQATGKTLGEASKEAFKSFISTDQGNNPLEVQTGKSAQILGVILIIATILIWVIVLNNT